jgi:Lon protease-like protein
LLAAEKQTPLSSELRDCATVLKLVMEKIGMEHFPSPLKLDDATWVGYRLAEVLPLKLAAKQEMLDIDDPVSRLHVIRKFLVQQGLLT